MSGPSDSSLRQRRVVDLGTSSEVPDAPTFTPPSFTAKDLLSNIPSHCFHRSALKSSAYLLHDVVLAAGLIWAASHIDGNLSAPLSTFAWFAYSFVQGMVCTGIWVIAHECGHQAFSTSKTLNNSVGWVLHSTLLVPYHSWRISHARHHAATGHMARDQVFVPKTRSQYSIAPEYPTEDTPSTFKKLDEVFEDAPFWALANLLVQQLFGWPLYLFTNASGQAYSIRTNHFEPSSPIFDVRHHAQILWSDFGLVLTMAALYLLGEKYGSWTVIKFYVFPYLWVNNWLVLITYLQHTDPMVPHYRDGEWNFQRGALSTVDRNFMGFIGAWLWHGITETHVSHHICSRIPHYNAWDATEALKPVLGSHYLKSNENMLFSAFKSYRECCFVEDDGNCIFYKNCAGKAARTVVYQDSLSDSGVDVQ